jgi:hypothetical protein
MSRRPGSGVQAYRRRAADTERMVDGAVADIKAARAADFAARKEASNVERNRLHALDPIDPARMNPGVIVGDRAGRVGAVVRVNRTTVTVAAGGTEQRLNLNDVIAISAPKETA